jgi:hypothetical protein
MGSISVRCNISFRGAFGRWPRHSERPIPLGG